MLFKVTQLENQDEFEFWVNPEKITCLMNMVSLTGIFFDSGMKIVVKESIEQVIKEFDLVHPTQRNNTTTGRPTQTEDSCPVCGKPENEHNDGLFCCPFCGGPACIREDEENKCTNVVCVYCGAEGPWVRDILGEMNIEYEARERWNKRSKL